jgi:15-cis-phytoene synthase
MTSLRDSYKWCEQVARTQAKNFYYSFLLLSTQKRKAMCAMYAFMRYCDDLSDAEGVADRAGSIAQWRADLEKALSGQPPAPHPLWPAFIDAVSRYQIPHKYFFEMIDGVSSDLDPRFIATFTELYNYCYHVASVVGLVIIHIFGFESPEALALAEKCGIAFQLTNILRDVGEDRGNGRIYLPREDFERFGVSPDSFQPHEKFRSLLKYQGQRARAYYRDSAPLIGLIDKDSRASMRALIGIYARLLDRIEEANYEVLKQRIRVPTVEKAFILARSLLG